MKKLLFKKYTKGFTLIELLVVIAIIGILTAIITANFGTAKSKSRDAKRISDIAQIQLTLEQAFDRCNAYPASIYADEDISTNCPGIKMTYFISKVPTDNGTPYEYVSNTDKTDYVMLGYLENNNSVLIDDIDTIIGTGFSNPLRCDDTAASPKFNYCVQPK